MRHFRRQLWRKAARLSPSYQKPAFLKRFDVSGMSINEFKPIADKAENALWHNNFVNWRVRSRVDWVFVNGELYREQIFEIATRFFPSEKQLLEFNRIVAPLSALEE